MSIENLIGTDGKDTLIGNNSNNTLDGGTGNDSFIAHEGNNSIIGGDGVDTIDYSQSLKAIVVENMDTTGTVLRGTGAAQNSDELNSIEKIIGSSYKDVIKADVASSVEFQFHGGSGNDTLQGGLGDDNLYGDSGDDYFYASGGSDYIDGGSDGEITGDTIDFSQINAKIELTLGESGNSSVVQQSNFNGTTYDAQQATHTLIDIENITGSLNHENILRGNSQNNTLIGGNENDILSGGNGGTNYLEGGLGVNTVDYSAISVLPTAQNLGITLNLNNSALQEVFTNSSGIIVRETLNNIQNVIGSSYKDVIRAKDGENNVLNGGLGDDTFIASRGNDEFIGHENSIDVVDYTYAKDALGNTIDLVVNINDGAQLIHADYGTHTFSNINGLIGSDGNDILIGNSGQNTLIGGKGDDTLLGYGGNDYLDGSEGINSTSFAFTAVGVNVDLSNTNAQDTKCYWWCG
jgi:Ca2+-binding RTX toxin-like protein